MEMMMMDWDRATWFEVVGWIIAGSMLVLTSIIWVYGQG